MKVYHVTYDDHEYGVDYAGTWGIYSTVELAKEALAECHWKGKEINEIELDVCFSKQDYGKWIRG